MSAILVVAACARAWAGVEDDVKPPRYKRGGDQAVRPPFLALADVPEGEPNNQPAQAQFVGCGNSFRPASLTNTAVRDTDWIALNANAGDLITFETAADAPGPETDTVISLIEVDGSTILATNDDAPAGGTAYSRIESFLAPYTGLYYGRIRGLGGAQGPYRANIFCITPPPPPANDQCAGAIGIPCGSIAISGSTESATDDYDLCVGSPVCPGSCTGFYTPGRDVAYRLDVMPGDRLDVTYQLNPSSTDASLYVVSDCGNVTASCVAGHDSGNGTAPETLTYTFAQSGRYFLILDAFTSGGAMFTLTGKLDCGATPSNSMTWGKLKAIYR